MRSKFIFGILLPAILMMALALVFKEHFVRVSRHDVPAIAAPAPNLANESHSPLPPPVQVIPAPIPAPVVARPMTQDEIQAERDRLVGWEMNNDPQSLSNILADLNSPEKEIRMAAIEAATQFDSSNAIPSLKAAAASDPDLEEKIALLQAADFLSTPALVIDPNDRGTLMTPEQIKAEEQEDAQDAAERQARLQAAKQLQTQQQEQNANSPATQQSPSH